MEKINLAHVQWIAAPEWYRTGLLCAVESMRMRLRPNEAETMGFKALTAKLMVNQRTDHAGLLVDTACAGSEELLVIAVFKMLGVEEKEMADDITRWTNFDLLATVQAKGSVERWLKVHIA